MRSGRELLRAWLRRSNLKQTVFAEQIRVKDGDLSRYLSGKRCPTLPIAVRIEDVTGIPARSWLLKPLGSSAFSGVKPRHKPAKTSEIAVADSHGW